MVVISLGNEMLSTTRSLHPNRSVLWIAHKRNAQSHEPSMRVCESV